MSLSPAVIDALVASGCTVEQLAAAMKASLAEGEARAADKRAKDAERQRKHRERNAVSRDVTVTNGDSVTSPSLSLPPNENNSNPPTHTHPSTTPRERAPARKGSRFPADWQPSAFPESVQALVDLWPPGRLDREFEQFRDYWLDRTDKRPGWDRTFHNRIRDVHDRVMRENRDAGSQQQHGKPIRTTGSADHRSARQRAVDEALASF